MSRIEKALSRADHELDGSSQHAQSQIMAPDDSLAVDIVDMSPEFVDPHLITVHEPESATSEHYRRFKVKLRLIQRPTRSILFTSAIKGEGKSTTWLNMAVTMARDPNCTVVAVDADLRKHALEQLLPVADGPGLTDVVRGEAALNEALRPTTIEGLSLLPTGSHVNDPVELLSLPEMAETLRKLTARYDCVLVDSPPVLAVTDPTVLGTLVDSVVMIVRASRTSKNLVERAISMLDKSEITGFVFNDAREPSNDYYYKYYQRGSTKEK